MRVTYKIVAFGCIIFQGNHIIATVPSEAEALEWIADHEEV